MRISGSGLTLCHYRRMSRGSRRGAAMSAKVIVNAWVYGPISCMSRKDAAYRRRAIAKSERSERYMARRR